MPLTLSKWLFLGKGLLFTFADPTFLSYSMSAGSAIIKKSNRVNNFPLPLKVDLADRSAFPGILSTNRRFNIRAILIVDCYGKIPVCPYQLLSSSSRNCVPLCSGYFGQLELSEVKSRIMLLYV